MADQPISQEILLPTNVDQVNAATKKLDELIAHVGRLDKAGESRHGHEKKNAKESESAFHNLFDAMGKVVKREVELAAGIRSVGAAGLEAKHKVGEFLEFVGAVAALELLEKLGDKVVDIGKEAIVSAAKAERMNFAIDAASGGREGGENTRRWLEANAKHSEFTEEQNESAYLQLRRFGVGQDKAGLYMKAAEDLAAVSAPGEREGVYQEALSSFARLHAKGRLDARSAMRLGIGVEDLKTLPGFKGLSNQKVWEKAETSNLDENTLMSLVMKHTGEKAIGEKAADASGLLTTKFSKLAELPERFYKRLGETGSVKKLASEIDVILEKLDPDSPTGKRIFGALESMFTSITEAVGEIDFDSLADSITDDVIPAIKEMVSLIGPAMNAVETTVHGLSVAGHFITGRAAAGKDQATAEIDYQKNMLIADDANAGFFTKLLAAAHSPFLRHKAGIEREAADAGRDHGTGFAQGIESSSGMSEAAAADTGEGSHDALMSSIDARSPSRKTREAGGHFGEGFALGIEGKMGRIEDAIDSTIRIPSAGGATSIAGIGRRTSVSFGDINITVEGGHTNAETAGAIRDELRRSIKPMFIDLMEEIDAEAGG